MRIVKYICLIFAFVIFPFTLASCGIAEVNNDIYKSPKEFLLSDDFVISQNGEYTFEFVSDNASVALKNANGEVVWSTSPLESNQVRYDQFGMPIKLHSKVKSPIIIEYIEPTAAKAYTAYSYTDCTQNGTYNVEKIKNGVKVTYFFEEFKISVPVEYTFVDSVVRMSVKSSEITEDKHLLYSVSLAPYACGIDNLSQNGYLFIPSGSGAIVEPCQLEMGSYTYSRELYGNDATRYRERELDTEIYPENRLAVYGTKISDNSTICAIIEKGAEHAFVEAEVGAANTGYSSVWSKFAFRAYQWSKIKKEQQVKLYSNDMSQDTVSVAFHILGGEENSGYIGMANTYRDYLIRKYGMKSDISDSLLNLKFIGGANVTETFLGFQYNEFFKTTTLNQAKKIISELKKEVDGSVNVDLIGFGESGIDITTIAGGYTVNDDLGGVDGLKKLASFSKKNNCNLFFNADVLGFGESGEGVYESFDAALAQNKQKIKQYYYNIYLRKKTVEHDSYLLVSRSMIPEICNNLSEEFSSLGIKGFGLDTLSSVCYSDYSEVKYFNKGNMANDVSKAINKLKKKHSVAVNEANDYAAASSDIIFDIPITSSKNNMFSYDVPFYGIVFKGYIPIATPSVNLAVNSDNMILSAAEIGAGLSYTLINNGGTELFDSHSSAFYGSVYKDIKQDILDDINKYQNDFKSVENAKISSHSILENGLRRTKFDNNVSVYTNYTADTLYIDEQPVGAGEYLFVKE